METVGSHSGQDSELGFPVAATITAATSIASTVLPSVLGGKSPAERRRQVLRQRQEVQRKWQIAKRELEQLRSSLDMTVEEARQTIENGATSQQRLWLSRWMSELEGLPGREEVARLIAEEAQSIHLSEARWTLVKAASPWAVGGLAAAAGVATLAFAYGEKQEDEDSSASNQKAEFDALPSAA
jgi:hypothetical protein